LIAGLGEQWYGWEFWYVATELKMNPSQMAATWAPAEVSEAFFFLRLKYLKEAPGGV
jgi:hypothetical protein